MLPTLVPGEEFVVTNSRPAVPGDVVALFHPKRQDFWLVKRLQRIDSSGAWVESDNLDVPPTDSRTFGPVPRDSLMPRVERLDDVTFREALELLSAEDDALAGAIAAHGLPSFWHRQPGFRTLVLLILEQQVSLESGAAMYRRVEGLLDEVTPATVAAAGESSLRGVGVTRQKAGYLTGLAQVVATGEFDLEDLETKDAQAGRSRLTELKGIGTWTADAYLLSALRLPDIFPTGDRALQVGAKEVVGLNADPTEEELELISKPWQPVRAAAARLIWHVYLANRGRVEPATPVMP